MGHRIMGGKALTGELFPEPTVIIVSSRYPPSGLLICALVPEEGAGEVRQQESITATVKVPAAGYV